jgi:AraC-like DNA-binding protein
MIDRPERLRDRPVARRTGEPRRRPADNPVVAKQVARRAVEDVPGQLIASLRIESSVLCWSVVAAPWGFGVPSRPEGSFHLLMAGEGWLEVDGVTDSIQIATGDLVILPNGSGHRLKDSHRSSAPPLASILAEHDLVDGELRFGGTSGPGAEVVCGMFALEGGRPPWLDRLGPVVVSPESAGSGEWRTTLAGALRDEAKRPTAGGAAIVNRWLESILADALRNKLSDGLDGRGPGLALADERIGRVLARIHEDPAAHWTLASLADEAAMSRSAFAARFHALVGEPPGTYLSRTRLDLAERLLRTSDATVADVARRVGYASEEALSRAFKARKGHSPSAVRQERRPART